MERQNRRRPQYRAAEVIPLAITAHGVADLQEGGCREAGYAVLPRL